MASRGKRDLNDVAVREFIKSYGRKYGLQDSDIGYYTDDSLGDTGMMVTIGGIPVGVPSYLEDGVSYMNQDLLQAAIDKAAEQLGLQNQYETPEYNIPEYQAPEHYQDPEPYQAPEPYKAPEAPTAYTSPYADKIDALLAEIMSPASFSYSADTDPAFQAYKAAYNREGDRAMKNAIAESSGITGGRLNTWAVSAAQQAQDYWNSRIMDVIPQLYEAAYSKYRDSLNDKRTNLGLLSQLDNTQYGRYRDTVADYQDARNFGYAQYLDERNFGRQNYEIDRAFDRANYETDRAFDRSNYEADRAFNRNIYESDRAYDRGVFESDQARKTEAARYKRADLESDRAFAASEEQRALDNAYRTDRAARADYETDRAFNYQVTRDQVMDEQWMKQFNAQEQQRIITNALNERQISSQEANYLLNKTELELKKEQTEWEKEQKEKQAVFDTIGPLYKGMMSADDPKQWLIDNADWLTAEELKILSSYLPKEDDEITKIIKEKLK